MFKRIKFAVLAASTILSISAPAMAQEQVEGQPLIRERLWSPGSVNAPDVYSWMQTIGNCSTSCGTGQRVLGQQCQNISDYAPDGTFGPAEPDSMCVANAGPRPADVTQSCTVLTSCTYDWVKPSVQQNPLPVGSNPVGRVGCGYVHETFSPYCQRNGGASAVVMAPADHGFCSVDRPDYDDVASGNPDALGYDRNVTQIQSCNTSDHEWRTTAWSAWSSTCDAAATSTRTVTCYRKFDNSVQTDAACDAGSQPAASRVEAQYASCSYTYSYGQWSAWSSACDTNATRTRTATCTRSNNGGSSVAAAECTNRSIPQEDVTQTSPQYGSCSYEFKAAAWGAWSSACDSGASRSRDVWCERSNGDRVADSECTSRGQTKPATSESGEQYGSCGYSWNQSGWSAWSSDCSNSASRIQTVTCIRGNNGGTAVGDSECTSRGQARPASSETTGRYGSCSYASGGTPTSWSAWNSTCSANARRSRTYQCVRNNDGGQIVGASECTSRGVNLTESQNAPVYDSCSHNWATGGWSGFNSSCSNYATQTRSVWCRRDLDGATVSDGLCNAGTRPGATNTAGQYGSCSYARGGSASGWSGWNSGCSASAQRSRTWQCIRNNDGGQAVNGSECTNRGINLTETETSGQYGSCSHNWATGGWSGWNSGCSGNAVSTRSVWCRRDLDGATVADNLCNGGNRPASSQTSEQYGSCSYYGGPWWGDWTWNSTCSASAQRTQHRTCMRSDGTPMPSGQYCTDRGVPVSETVTEANYSGCSYRLEDAGVGACQSNNQAPHYWRCIRNQTGEQVDSAAYCGRSNPTYDACQYYSYNWQVGDFSSWNSSCSHAATRTRSVQCRRNPDGAIVGDQYCGAGKASAVETRADYSGCSYTPNYGAWSACQSNNQQTRSMTSCIRSLDGAGVDWSECTNRGHQTTQIQGCTYATWKVGLSCTGGTLIGSSGETDRGPKATTGRGSLSREQCIASGGNCWSTDYQGSDGEQGRDWYDITESCFAGASLYRQDRPADRSWAYIYN